MQRPLEEERKQEDRAELLGRGVRTSPLAPLIPSQLSLGNCLCLFILPVCDPHMCTEGHACEKPHMHLQTRINKKPGRKKKKPMKSNFPLSHTHYSKLVRNHKSSQCFQYPGALPV